ncbi:MAG: ABC transporter ATP-binding protein [Desulfovibrio sp.]|nr:MAG: ABC transporter ATP-binding protein [Desulfovibrio sp.]
MQRVIEVSKVSFAYTDAPVLEKVDLCVHQGDFLAVVGPNGGGKTTLLKLILGLLTPDSGEVRVFGRSPKNARARMGYVPQYADLQPGFPITVLQVALMGLPGSRLSGFTHTRKEKSLARQALARVGVADLERRRMDALSGGQRQRVLVARALASNPELLIFDEPTSNIDPHGKFCFYEMLAELGQDMTIVVVSHDLSVTAAKVSSVACVNHTLLHNSKPEFTPEMLTLLYGAHGHTCPMGEYIDSVSGVLATAPVLTQHDHAGREGHGHD